MRRALLAWYGVILVAVLVSFGAVAYHIASAAVMGTVDASLKGSAGALAGAVDYDSVDGWELDLSDEYMQALGATCFWRIWSPDGEPVLGGGESAPDAPAGAGIRTRGDVREVEVTGRRDARVVVGRSIAPELGELSTFRTGIVAGGVLIYAAAMLGGWLVARRTLKPVARLAASAAGISERDLAARIPADAPAELKPLVDSFNAVLERLEAAFSRQTRFTADASHELRTPLSVIRTQAEVALRRERSPAEQRTALEACLRAAERMTHVVEGLLTLARADRGEAEVKREPMALAQVVEQAVASLQIEAQKAGVTLRCDAQPVSVVGDAALLAVVVSNLVGNAIRYNRPDGRIDVSLSAGNGGAVLAVKDTGMGMPADALPRLFERFYRVDPARSRERGGSGLGLAITRWIVEAHHGSIDVTSRAGEGSEFKVHFPVKP